MKPTDPRSAGRVCRRQVGALLSAALISLYGGEAAMGQAIVAHRGASREAPENTLSAFKLAWEKGADAIEGDFYLTKDGEIVCIHDETTGRTAGGESLRVSRSTLAQLRRLDVGAWKGERWSGERIPTLSEVLAVVPKGKRLLVEIKCGVEIVRPLAQVLAESRIRRGQVAIIAFSADVIAACKRALPKVPAFWLTGFRKDSATGGWTPSLERILETLARTRADGLDCNAHPSIDEAFVRRLKRRKLELHVWTVDDPRIAARFQALGVDSITTNRPAFLREVLRPG